VVTDCLHLAADLYHHILHGGDIVVEIVETSDTGAKARISNFAREVL
jgi:hypothetical protein